MSAQIYTSIKHLLLKYFSLDLIRDAHIFIYLGFALFYTILIIILTIFRKKKFIYILIFSLFLPSLI
jgi:hypothetical protein